ncbi:GDSL esterase/lipase At5g37690-like [Abrus precatorius]|uniref:GDSL esterase/lipase At5g37690-like n=1 Tax=Abrus precatorius TaxID=3816 RepID=A0A8B8KVT2_ABRPR|nr:GDSL esterase/lipase At5g37690-like [Abrus precatorius]
MAMLYLFVAIFLAMVGSCLNWNTESAVPAVFLFGDSTLDVGTNNFLNDSQSRADMPFYGIDFPNKNATGRFSNGYNTADRIVKLLGFDESPPPYFFLLNSDTENFKSHILKGVNFASGGSGILPETGKQNYIDVVSMGDQIQQFKTVHDNISQYLNGSAEATINKSLFLVSAGSNDIFDFFFFNIDKNPGKSTLKVLEFISKLMSNYQAHLKNLYDLGARKFGILSVPPIGCVPILSAFADPSTHCVNEINDVAQIFHVQLDRMLQNLSSECPGMKYSLGDSYNITFTMINNADLLHLDNVTSACCGNQTFLVSGLIGVPCSPNATVCENHNNYLFWDQFHPTEYVSTLAASMLYNNGSEFVTPINFRLLVEDS